MHQWHINNLGTKAFLVTKSTAVDVAGKLPRLTETFDADSDEARPSNQIMDVFSNRISFHPSPNGAFADKQTTLLDYLCLDHVRGAASSHDPPDRLNVEPQGGQHLDHHDVHILSLFPGDGVINLMNVYSDKSSTAINLLHQEVDNLPAFHYVGSDFNCHSLVWDTVVAHHQQSAQHLVDMCSDLRVSWSRLVNHRNTLVPHNPKLNGLVIDLAWTQLQPDAINLPRLEHDHRGTLDHVPISILLPIVEADICITRTVVPKGSDKEKAFLGDISLGLGLVDTPSLDSDDKIEAAAHAVAEVFSRAWQHHAKEVVITNCSKSWWDDECDAAIKRYHESWNPMDYMTFQWATRAAKCKFFNEKIKEIVSEHQCRWVLKSKAVVSSRDLRDRSESGQITQGTVDNCK
ncbi:hypothetical protein NP233_g8683 [Leucocoprinus birnbaumii]|uniref:Endonuclease/exonuclease/phosphatase domain-containing protein n=1 Tax=Leucocoprinus birnbaumii TaxID=56174 RepID=A0AAD5YRM2_9AGAR|nr:hypothetical protein NP233_g8683 [Leucocoprinus birnbaumii]